MSHPLATLAFSPFLALPVVQDCPAWSRWGDAEDRFGSSFARAGDVDGDGYDDVIVGANYAGLGGRAYLFQGAPSGISPVPAWISEGPNEFDEHGSSVAGAGDVNGDGYDDALVAAYGDSRVSLYLGEPSGLGLLAAWNAESTGFDEFGAAAASAGDVNGDGFDDLLIGAPSFDNGEVDEGAAFLYLGSASGPASTPAWMGESNQPAFFYPADYGLALASAGDVNADGFDDVIVGARGYSLLGLFRGGAFVYLGGAAGLSPTPAWTKLGEEGDFFGRSVAGAGDVDGDGDSEVLVVGIESGVQLFLGSPTGLGSSAAWAQAESHSAAGAGDVNADGFDDVILAQGLNLRLFLGSPAGLGADWTWSVGQDQGLSTAGAGDVNQDGFADMLMATPNADAAGLDHGRATLYLGASSLHRSSDAFPGSGVNRDVVTPIDVVTGRSWSAPARLLHAHGTSGALVLSVRSSTTLGAPFTSPIGGRRTQTLIAGPLLARVVGSHASGSGDVPPQLVPADPTLVGAGWAAQYTVVGGGHADLSQAVFGVVYSCP